MLKRQFQSGVNLWLDKRIPPASDFTLDLGNIFIFPSRFGMLYLLLCGALFVLGTNYQNNLILLLGFFLLALFLVSLLSSYLNFAGLRVLIGKVGYPFAGDSACLPLWIDTSKQKHHAHGRLHLGIYNQKIQISVDLDRLTNPAEFTIATTRRGRLPMPRITLNSYYPLGLFRCWTHLRFDSQVLVYPCPLPCSVITYSQAGGEESQGNTATEEGYDDFDSLMEYQPGQPLYHVAWKQVAKGQGMVSKKFSSTSNNEVWLRLQQQSTEDLETRLSHLCFMVLELENRGQRFGLEVGSKIIQPGKGNAHRHQCLSALALYQTGHTHG
ncbi:DUF58 domain-containing protein [Lacimicrobium alkaliphilum]|uniref:Uncharacterized protein n=1 Tax=Lacimicrobium alkaliphilum TaxID=1526571 RepID=A0A0U2RKY8_9ALTE|nr:DUF58 domain-containing protein [Lacimicrobium alkaliphilum]ALS97946.1 hypothetical protein AT746_06485 [Lacimicrobium alkaliphilum]